MKRSWFTRYHHSEAKALTRGPIQPTFAVLGSDLYTNAPPAPPFDPVPPERSPSPAPATRSGAGASFLDYLQ